MIMKLREYGFPIDMEKVLAISGSGTVGRVRLILTAGGIPVLAHPGLNRSTLIIRELIDAGLAGVEAYHPAHSREQESYYKRLADEYGLLVTGGSDYHGPGHKAGCRLGLGTVPYKTVQKLREKKHN